MNHQVTDHYDSESILHDNMVVASLDMSETNGKKNTKVHPGHQTDNASIDFLTLPPNSINKQNI